LDHILSGCGLPVVEHSKVKDPSSVATTLVLISGLTGNRNKIGQPIALKQSNSIYLYPIKTKRGANLLNARV